MSCSPLPSASPVCVRLCVRAKSLKSLDVDDTDGADAKIPAFSAPEKGSAGSVPGMVSCGSNPPLPLEADLDADLAQEGRRPAAAGLPVPEGHRARSSTW